MSAAGVLLATTTGIERFPGFRVEAVDTTAAGDAYNGGLAVALAGDDLSPGEPLPAAIRYAQAVAALSVTQRGAQPSLPTADAVAAFLNSRSAHARNIN
ncbi:MAG: PfkB family carbohydrate kinase [Anaerolineales bacterium]